MVTGLFFFQPVFGFTSDGQGAQLNETKDLVLNYSFDAILVNFTKLVVFDAKFKQSSPITIIVYDEVLTLMVEKELPAT